MNQHEKAPRLHQGTELRRSYDAFCDRYSGVWLDLACDRLHEEERALRAVEELKRQVKDQWCALRRKEYPAYAARKLLANLIVNTTETVLGAGQPPRNLQGGRRPVERAQGKLRDLGQRQDVDRALRRLPEIQRTAVLLRHGHGHDYPVIAESLGMSEERTKDTVHQGMRKLRRLLGAEETENEE
ncbi:sigma-70 family RNA polymerase sigma factor [Kitasatospora sp. NPDC092948]|uniref:sigma-70 family RNA polymerase sigma factor n=1 Tax=Kitasatospora sp. NPDC092948 TaxID=3364088 RepID=UPI0037FE327B